jgi:hypothetical protein
MFASRWGEGWPVCGSAARTESGNLVGISGLSEVREKTGWRWWRFPTGMEICKSITITRGAVSRAAPRSSQNGLTTTSTTIAIIAIVGNSFITR